MTDEKSGWPQRWGIDAALACLLFVIAIVFLERQPADRFHVDEAHKISESHYFHRLRQGELRHPEWQSDFYARINPPIGKYLMGGLMQVQGEAEQDGHLQDLFEQHWQQPEVLQSHITPVELAAARRSVMLFAAGCVVLMYLTGRLIASRWVGVIAAALLLGHPMFVRYGSLALTDVLLLFFMSAIVPLLICILSATTTNSTDIVNQSRSSLWRNPFTEILLPTLLLLGAAGTKLNGGLASLLWIAAAAGGGWLTSSGSTGRRLFRTASLALIPPIAALGLFIALNPALYDHPIDSLLAMPRIYGDWMIKQAIAPGEAVTSYSRTWSEAFFHVTFREERRLHHFSLTFPMSVLLSLVLIGTLSLVWNLWSSFRRGRVELASFVAVLWIAIYGIGIFGWIPVDWDRYFLPLIPLQSVLAAVGLCRIVTAGRLALFVAKGRADAEVRQQFQVASIVIVTSLAASLVVPGLTDLSLVSPSTLSEYGVRAQQIRPCLQRGADRHPDDPVRLMHLAEYLKSTGVPQAALPYARAAEAKFSAAASLHSEAMHAAFEYKLADLEASSGNDEAARQLLLKNVARIKDISSRLSTQETKINSELSDLVLKRKTLAIELGQPSQQP